MSNLSSGATSPANQLAVAELVKTWKQIQAFLPFDALLEQRSCPHCGQIGARAATLCGHCWKVLVPPPKAHVG